MIVEQDQGRILLRVFSRTKASPWRSFKKEKEKKTEGLKRERWVSSSEHTALPEGGLAFYSSLPSIGSQSLTAPFQKFLMPLSGLHRHRVYISGTQTLTHKINN